MPFNPFYDFFDDPSSWTVYASGLSEGRLVHTKGYKNKSGLRLDYDFHGGGGYIVIRKEVQRALPDTFEFSFHLKGKGSKNRLEFKISDPGGADVWRFLQEDWNPTNQWERMTVRERDLRFAWGPEGGGAPVVIGSIEFAIAAGSGGKGTIYFSDLSMEDQTLYLPVHFSASSHHPNYPPRAVFEQGSPSGWRAVAGDPDPYWCTDFGRINRFGGMIITWPIPMPPREFEIESSRDGLNWIQIFKASHAMGLRTHVPAQGAEARYVRIKFANAAFAAIGSLELKADTFSHTQNDFLHAVACDFPRGWFPRYWHHEQSYWTPIGCPEGKKRGLINEEGLVEVDEGGFSLEPFLLLAGNLITWAEADISLSFPRDGVPFPEVTWIANQMTLRVIPWVDGTGESLTLRVTYEVVNMSGHEVRFVIAARPYQVNPPWQAFRNLGGASHVHHVKCEHGYLLVEGRQVIPDTIFRFLEFSILLKV